MARSYDEVAADIGIAGPEDDDTSVELSRFRPLLPPHEPDTNAGAAFASYQRSRERVRSMGLSVGRAPSAVLSRRLERDGMVREANPTKTWIFTRMRRDRCIVRAIRSRAYCANQTSLIVGMHL